MPRFDGCGSHSKRSNGGGALDSRKAQGRVAEMKADRALVNLTYSNRYDAGASMRMESQHVVCTTAISGRAG